MEKAQRGITWSYLEFSKYEVSDLEKLIGADGIKATVYEDYAATEEAFKELGNGKGSPRIIHLATHGYFFDDPEEKQVNKGKINTAGLNQPVYKISDHPMIRSGLIMAGGNYAWHTGESFLPGMEDGILTAYEISQLDLSNTEIAVLSACETGLGDIRGNEGVFGLQRAFKIAGVRYIIMALWVVPDEESADFMTLFYQKWLEEDMTIPGAFREAQREMSAIRYIKPYSWAGFVLME